jgi:S1-C subfamily serine protease
MENIEEQQEKIVNLTEQLLFNTVRLEGVTETGSYSVGTGFLYMHRQRIVVTNKHVVKGITKGKITLHQSFVKNGRIQLRSATANAGLV